MAVACPILETSKGYVITMTNWYCIYTKSKHEDQVEYQLVQLPGIEILNPKLKLRKYIRGKLRDVTEGLFPSYIFSRFNPKDYYSLIRYTRGIRRVIGDPSGNPYIVDHEIIWQIQSRIKNGFVHIDQQDFRTGDQVVIQEGPMKGLNGVFQQNLKARDRVLILLNTIEYQASIAISKNDISKL